MGEDGKPRLDQPLLDTFSIGGISFLHWGFTLTATGAVKKMDEKLILADDRWCLRGTERHAPLSESSSSSSSSRSSRTSKKRKKTKRKRKRRKRKKKNKKI